MSSPTNRVPVPYLHNVVPEPNLPPLTEPGNGVYILLCDAASSTDAVPSQSRPTSVSREGQTAKRCAEITMLQVECCFRSGDCFRPGLMSCQPIYDCQNRNAIRQRQQTKMKAVSHNVWVWSVAGLGGLSNGASRNAKADKVVTVHRGQTL